MVMRVFIWIPTLRSSEEPRIGPEDQPNPLAKTSALRDRGLLERRAQAFGELHGVVVGPEVNEEHSGLLREHVIVDRRHLDAVLPQRPDQRVDLLAGDQEIAG